MRNHPLLKLLLFLAISSYGLKGIAQVEQVCKDYILSDTPNERYTVQTFSGVAVVTDQTTGLMWQQCSVGLSGADCNIGSAIEKNWQGALQVAGESNINQIAGFIDWRVPNVEELRSIVAYHCSLPSINSSVFPNTASARYWSSSPFMSFGNTAWSVHFGNGSDAATDERTKNYRVRLVR